MRKIAPIGLATALAVVGSGVIAQGFEHVSSQVTLYFETQTFGSTDQNRLGLLGQSTYSFGSGFGVEFGLGWEDSAVNIDSFERTLTSVSVAPSYEVGNGVTVGLFYDFQRLGFGGGSDVDFTLYGATVGYTTPEGLALDAFYGIGGFDGETDITSFGIEGSYALASGMFVGAFYERDSDSNGALDILTEYGVAIGYGFDALGLPVTVSAEYGFSTYDNDFTSRTSTDYFGIGITVPLGGSEPATPELGGLRGVSGEFAT